MPDPGVLNDKVRAYIEALSPAARAMLLRSMQKARERGEATSPTEAILKAIGQMSGDQSAVEQALVSRLVPAADRGEMIRAAFFAPAELFLFDVALPTKVPARLFRGSLTAIWTWLNRDIATAEIDKACRDEVADPVAAGAKLRRILTPRLTAILVDTKTNPKGQARLAFQLGSEAVLQDLGDLLYIFHNEAKIAGMLTQLPKTIALADNSESPSQTDLAKVKKAIDDSQLDPHYIAVLMLSRASNAAAVADFAVRMANTSDPRIVHQSFSGRIIDAVISEVDLWVRRTEAHIVDRPNRAAALEDLRGYRDLVRQLDLVVSPSEVPAWHKRLGAARRTMSELIAKEIESVSGLLRRSLRVDAAHAGSGQFDVDALEDAEFGIRLLWESRNALDSLALNELVNRQRRQVEQTLEVMTAKLLSDLKSRQGTDRTNLLTAADGAIRISAVVFGEEYSQVLKKGRDLAIGKQVGRAAS
ncbi:MAG: hypothetical protein P4L82_05770 [Ancalomicrobiaceae bacterium]|nr:hypothetical protein [Ancalomicrobiaceae bacterium]